MQENNNNNWFERHPRLTLSLSTFVGLLLVLFVAEMTVRAFVPAWAPMTAERAVFWQYHDQWGWHHIPDKQAVFKHPDFAVDVRINSKGLRDNEYDYVRTRKKRMLVLGDSYGWGFGVEHSEIFSSLLEQRYADWEIINASVSGYGTVQQELYLQQEGGKYQADVILLLFYDNDFRDNVGLSSYWYNKPFVAAAQTTDGEAELYIEDLPVPPQSLRQRIDGYILGNFYLARGIYPYLGMVLDGIYHLFASPVSFEPADEFAATSFALDQLIKTAEQQGSRVVVVQTPLSKVKHQVIAEQCRGHSIDCLHLNKTFKKKEKDWHFPSDRHWNAKGHRLAADAIDHFLAEKHYW